LSLRGACKGDEAISCSRDRLLRCVRNDIQIGGTDCFAPLAMTLQIRDRLLRFARNDTNTFATRHIIADLSVEIGLEDKQRRISLSS